MRVDNRQQQNEVTAYKKGGDEHIKAVVSKAVCNYTQPMDDIEIRHAHNKCWTLLNYNRSGPRGDCIYVTNRSTTTSSQILLLSGRPGRMGMNLDVGLNGAHLELDFFPLFSRRMAD